MSHRPGRSVSGPASSSPALSWSSPVPPGLNRPSRAVSGPVLFPSAPHSPLTLHPNVDLALVRAEIENESDDSDLEDRDDGHGDGDYQHETAFYDRTPVRTPARVSVLTDARFSNLSPIPSRSDREEEDGFNLDQDEEEDDDLFYQLQDERDRERYQTTLSSFALTGSATSVGTVRRGYYFVNDGDSEDGVDNGNGGESGGENDDDGDSDSYIRSDVATTSSHPDLNALAETPTAPGHLPDGPHMTECHHERDDHAEKDLLDPQDDTNDHQPEQTSPSQLISRLLFPFGRSPRITLTKTRPSPEAQPKDEEAKQETKKETRQHSRWPSLAGLLQSRTPTRSRPATPSKGSPTTTTTTTTEIAAAETTATTMRRKIDVNLRLSVNWSVSRLRWASRGNTPAKPVPFLLDDDAGVLNGHDMINCSDSYNNSNNSNGNDTTNLDHFARVHGISLLHLPPHVTPVDHGVAVPVGIAATGRLIVRAAQSTRPGHSIAGLFRIPGRAPAVARLAAHFGVSTSSSYAVSSTSRSVSTSSSSTTSSASLSGGNVSTDRIEITVRAPVLPPPLADGIGYTAVDAAHAFKRVLASLRGGVLGHESVWHRLWTCTNRDSDTDSPDIDAVKAATVIMTIPSPFRRALIVAVFAVLRLVAEAGMNDTTSTAANDDDEKESQPHAMTPHSLGLVFAPLLLGTRTVKTGSVITLGVRSSAQTATATATATPARQTSHGTTISMAKADADAELARMLGHARLIAAVVTGWIDIVAAMRMMSDTANDRTDESESSPISPNFRAFGDVGAWAADTGGGRRQRHVRSRSDRVVGSSLDGAFDVRPPDSACSVDSSCLW